MKTRLGKLMLTGLAIMMALVLGGAPAFASPSHHGSPTIPTGAQLWIMNATEQDNGSGLNDYNGGYTLYVNITCTSPGLYSINGSMTYVGDAPRIVSGTGMIIDNVIVFNLFFTSASSNEYTNVAGGTIQVDLEPWTNNGSFFLLEGNYTTYDSNGFGEKVIWGNMTFQPAP